MIEDTFLPGPIQRTHPCRTCISKMNHTTCTILNHRHIRMETNTCVLVPKSPAPGHQLTHGCCLSPCVMEAFVPLEVDMGHCCKGGAQYLKKIFTTYVAKLAMPLAFFPGMIQCGCPPTIHGLPHRSFHCFCSIRLSMHWSCVYGCFLCSGW